MKKLSLSLLAASATLAASMFASQALANNGRCGARDAIVTQLTERHGERQIVLGLTGDGAVMELWTSPAGGWTLLASMASGKSCIVAVGEHLRIVVPQGPSDPA